MKIKSLTNSKAFTLIEILVVTSIISLLSTVVVNESKESRLKSEDAHMKTESNSLAAAINLYKNDNNGKVPVGVDHQSRSADIVYESDPADNGAAYRSSMQELVDGGYISEIPTSPSGESYSYYVTDDEESAMFGAELNNKTSNSISKNSCEFVQIKSYDSDDCYQDNNINGNGYVFEDSNLYFTTEYQYREDMQSSSNVFPKDDFCNAHGSPQCYSSQSDGNRPYLCTKNYSEWGGFGGSCIQILSSIEVLCPVVRDVVCDGSSDSNYCSCI